MSDDLLAREQERLRRHTALGGAGAKPAARPVASSGGNKMACHVCGKTVYSLEAVETEIGLFHKSCFKCKTCGMNLAFNSFLVVSGEVYCRRHGTEAQRDLPRAHKVGFSPASAGDFQGAQTSGVSRAPAAAPLRVCVGCGQNIRGGEPWNSACGDKTWHSRCFVCAHCGKQLTGDSLYEFDGKPYCCPECVSAASGSVCVRCGEPIVGEDCILLGGDESKPCHSKCYTCEGCGVSLADIDCYEIAGRSLCHGCAVKAASS